MDTKVNYAVIGAFVIIFFSFIVLGIIWLSSGFSVGQYTVYQVNMQEAVTGLSVDAVVEFNGVSVGNVKSITINHKNPHLVELLLDVAKDTPVTKGTIATLNTRGLTGITYIALKDKGYNLAPLQALPDQPYPIIRTEPSFFLQLDTALTKLNDSFGRVSTSIQELLNSQNQRSIKEILLNLAQVTTMLANNNQKLTGILVNTQAATQQLPQLVQTSTQAMHMLEVQTLPATNRMMSNIDDLTHNLTAVSEQLKSNPSILIRGKQPSPPGPGE